MQSQRNLSLPFLIALSNVIVIAIINIFQLILQIPLLYVIPQDTVGYDYRDFFFASHALLGGQSPYTVIRYVTPPLPAVLNVILEPFGFETARNLFLLTIPLTVFFSYLLLYLYFKDSTTRDPAWLMLSGIALILFSYPFYFLLVRGNIDGVVLICMVAGVLLLSKHVQAGSLLLAIAVLCKVYPLLLVVYLFATRRWKAFLWTCGWLAFLAGLTWFLWDDYYASSYRRLFFFRLDGNGSLVNTLMIVTVFARYFFTGKIASDFSQSSSTLAAIVYAATICLLYYSDYKLGPDTMPKEYTANAFLYLPFMVAVPQLVYHYEFVVLIPLLPVLHFLWIRQSSRPARFWLIWIAIGISLTQFQAVALNQLTENMLAEYIPGFGLLLIIIGISLFKILQLQDKLKAGQSKSLAFNS